IEAVAQAGGILSDKDNRARSDTEDRGGGGVAGGVIGDAVARAIHLRKGIGDNEGRSITGGDDLLVGIRDNGLKTVAGINFPGERARGADLANNLKSADSIRTGCGGRGRGKKKNWT